MNPGAMVNPNPDLLCQPPSSLVPPLGWLLYPHPQLDTSPFLYWPDSTLSDQAPHSHLASPFLTAGAWHGVLPIKLYF